MDSIEERVARHYTHGALERAIREGLEAMGLDPAQTAPDALAGVEEFHIGGREATEDLVAQMGLREGAAVLDIGCGIGGAARFLADRHGCHVTGVDLTPEYVAVARVLSDAVGLGERLAFRVGSATSLPFEDGAFDAATVLHVGMNVPDKRSLCAEAARVLRPGGVFGLYEVMRTGEGELAYPVPWAATAETSFVESPAAYRACLESAGFEVLAERERRGFALEFFARVRARLAESGPPPLGIQVVMGAEASVKIANMVANVEAGRVAPVEMTARRSPS